MILGFYLFAALFLFRALVLGEQTVVDLGLSLCMAATATLACSADSKVLGCPMTHAAKWVMLFTWLIAVPIYLFWSRGLRGGIVLLGLMGVYFALAFGLSLL